MGPAAYGTVDVQDASDQYYAILWNLLEIVHPQKSVTLTNCDPKFITPRIKSLLRSRNRLLHKIKTHAVYSITAQINLKIVAHNVRHCGLVVSTPAWDEQVVSSQRC